MLADRRVKIVATAGPSLNTYDQVCQALKAGMNVTRLNFSHGTQEQHAQVIKNLRQASMDHKAPLGVLQDLQGPKIRVGSFAGGGVELVEGETVTISANFKIGRKGEIPTDFGPLPSACRPGTRILLDDGLMELRVQAVQGSQVRAEVVYGGYLKDRKGMNLPGANLPIEPMTPKDLDDLQFGLRQAVDYVALSFVRRGKDIRDLRELIHQHRPGTKIIAKIEMLEALDHLEEIIDLSDGVMVARGDLAVEVGQSQLPILQKSIIRLCNEAARPVITATQMLDSMVENPRPTRAEITDVANAVLDGSDALMLSAESASGKHPFKCIQTMHEIISEVEKSSSFFDAIEVSSEPVEVAQAIAASACLTALKIKASAIVCLTSTGKTATMISSYRPSAKIIAVTTELETLNRLELAWGIQTFAIKAYASAEEAMKQIEATLITYGLVKDKESIVLTFGSPVMERAKTNALRVYELRGGNCLQPLKSEDLPLRCPP